MPTPLQRMLQSAVQSVHWTYTLFWHFCTQRRMLIWADGYYNGPIKTRKTLHPSTELTAEDASLQRSHQLRDLYESLSAGDTNQPLRRPCAALSPEDLTESEWFYLMCISFSFPPGVGLPGKAYAKKQHVWITGANEIDSKVFSRAILAKSARIKTVVCIPLMEGVVELGTTDKVTQDIGFIQHIKSLFAETHSLPPKPALSELSTSNSATSFDHYNPHLYSSPVPAIYDLPPNRQEEDDLNSTAHSDSEAETSNAECPSTLAVAAAGEPSELMQLELSEDIRLGSPDDADADADFRQSHLDNSLPNSDNNKVEYHRHRRRITLKEPACNTELRPPHPGTPPAAVFTEEDTHYSNTLLTLLQNPSTRWSDSSSVGTLTCSTQSPFSKWTPRSDLHGIPHEGEGTAISQCLLKHILHNVPFLHTKHRHENPSEPCDGPWLNGSPEDELTRKHVLAERCRRENLNEKFIILRSIVPFVTKMDKASILGDTVEYLELLRKKIQDLEAQNRELESSRRPSFEELQRSAAAYRTRYDQPCLDKRKLRILEGVGDGGMKPKMLKTPPHQPSPTSVETNFQVSIIGCDGLLELQCPYKEGLLLDILLTLQGLRIETTEVRSSLSNGVFIAELRAKVKENMDGKKASILEVKRAIQQIIPCIDT